MADFDGAALTSDAGGLLPGATDRAIRLVERFAAGLRDARRAEFVAHSVAMLAGKLSARRSDCAPAAGKSTLNRLELSREAADPLS